MDHSTMDHSTMDHSTMDHSTMDHSTMDHSIMDPSMMDPSMMDHSTMDHSTMTGADNGMVMTHPGFPFEWGVTLWAVMALCVVRALLRPTAHIGKTNHLTLRNIPGLGNFIAYVTTRPWVLFTLKLIFVALFLLIIAAGLSGTPLAERNAATVFTWNIWWAGLIVTIFFLGSAWCAICPWNTLANWLVRGRVWRRMFSEVSLNLRVPKKFRTVWPALFLLVGLTWLELGVGITVNPFATALLALFMVVLATLSLSLFERNPFCQFFCPVGRTIGFYSQLAPVELRPVDEDICANCTTLECYAGTDDVEACPSHLVMGRLKQNTYCTSCLNCARSCPHENVAWRLRSPSAEAVQDARPQWSEAWFMLGLLALAGFHGLTMMPFWENWMITFTRTLDGADWILPGFSILLVGALAVPVLFYAGVVHLTQRLDGTGSFQNLFCRFAFLALPLAFTYHLAHNLNHLLREGSNIIAVMANPFGTGTEPLSMAEKHLRGMELLISPNSLHAIQFFLMAVGFLICVRVIQARSVGLAPLEDGKARIRMLPLLFFAVAITSTHLWLLMQPMVMRF